MTCMAILLSCFCLPCGYACWLLAHLDFSDGSSVSIWKAPANAVCDLPLVPVFILMCCQQATSAPKSAAQPVAHKPAQPAVQPPVQQPEATTAAAAAAAAAADASEGQQQIDILEELQDVDSILDDDEAQLEASDCVVCLLHLCYMLCCMCDARCCILLGCAACASE